MTNTCVDPNTPHHHCIDHGCVVYVCCVPDSITSQADMDAVSAFDDGDASDVLATWGDLRATLTEARGWLSDIDVRDVDLRSDSEVIHLVQRMYGGGLAEFVLNTVML